mmetsp:Transcript_30298/g.76470  ORF Transcript_30298/g.76470 Transcript_30298/m.76470 type:complete len:135 (-) Transcript_30298:1741-2145(-)
MTPPWMATILSARRTVDRRCATTKRVTGRPPTPMPAQMSESRACCTACSASTSSELVASSKTSSGASFRMARAIVSLCFCPPDSCEPRGPMSVRSPSGRALTNSQASALLHASTIKRSFSSASRGLEPSSSCSA